jgi:hypothetical protein
MRQALGGRGLPFKHQMIRERLFRRVHDYDNDAAIFVQKTRRL